MTSLLFSSNLHGLLQKYVTLFLRALIHQEVIIRTDLDRHICRNVFNKNCYLKVKICSVPQANSSMLSTNVSMSSSSFSTVVRKRLYSRIVQSGLEVFWDDKKTTKTAILQPLQIVCHFIFASILGLIFLFFYCKNNRYM